MSPHTQHADTVASAVTMGVSSSTSGSQKHGWTMTDMFPITRNISPDVTEGR